MRDEIRLTCALVWTWVLVGGRCVVVRNARADGASWWSLPGGGVEARLGPGYRANLERLLRQPPAPGVYRADKQA